MDVYKLVREDERRALKTYFSADPLELVQAGEAAPRALLGAQGMTWRAYQAGPSRGGCPSGALGRLGVPGGR